MDTPTDQKAISRRIYEMVHGRAPEDYSLMTVRECCDDARISPATFYRIAKKDPKFPKLRKIGGSTRVRSDEWQAYLAALGAASEAAR